MMRQSEVAALQQFLGAASRRLGLLAATFGASIGLAVALIVALIVASLRWSGESTTGTLAIGASLAFVGALAGCVAALIRRRASRSVALDVERRAPGCRNVVVTAAELIDESVRVSPYVGDMVISEAATRIRKLDLAMLFPARSAMTTFGAIALAWVVALALIAAHDPSRAPLATRGSASDGPPPLGRIEIVVTPPSYSGMAVQTLRDPTRVDALVGSRIDLTVGADADVVSMETLNGQQRLRRAQGAGPGATYSGSWTADADGFIAISASAAGRVGPRRLIGLSVTPDHPPRLEITAPGKDLFLAEAKRTIEVAMDAGDDFGLASLKLRYTKVSGSGERFTFVEGELPVTITAANERSWKGQSALKLDGLGLVAGDMLVYRAIATDKRPGAAPAESDAFLVEITAPGMLAGEGFSLDDNQDKYALSQQMIILKTERLLARAARMPTDSVTYYSQLLAAEQRSVRAEFVFMMGGEVAEEVIAAADLADINEEAEAAREADLGAGRMVNRGRAALIQAIRLMSRSSALLNAADPARALPQEKAALVALQQAFSRTRYLLRALTQRERLDLSRRLTGVLSTAAPDVRPVPDATGDPRIVALRRALAGIAELAGGLRPPAGTAVGISMLAQTVLEIDPSSEALQRVSSDLSKASVSAARNDANETRRLLDGAATQLALTLRDGLLVAPRDPRSRELRRIAGELADILARVPLTR